MLRTEPDLTKTTGLDPLPYSSVILTPVNIGHFLKEEHNNTTELIDYKKCRMVVFQA